MHLRARLARSALKSPYVAVRRIGHGMRGARHVRERWRFLVRAAAGQKRPRAYTAGPVSVLVSGAEAEGLAEVFDRRPYEPPVELPQKPAIVDLGANIGLFCAWALARWPDAAVTAFEPDPTNLRRLRQFVALNDLPVTVIGEAASNTDGTVTFAVGQGSGSAISDEGAEIPARDVLPLMASADLAKLDIEGGEWAILQDPRLRDVRAQLALEYHRHLCPERGDALSHDPRPRLMAHRLLTEAGFEVRDVERHWWGHGTLAAWRPQCRAPEPNRLKVG